MIDALRQEAGVQAIPMRGFVGMDDRAGVDTAFQRRDDSASLLNTKGSVRPFALAHDDDDLALAVLIDRKAAVAAVLFVVGGLHVTAEIRAVDLDRRRMLSSSRLLAARASRIL